MLNVKLLSVLKAHVSILVLAIAAGGMSTAQAADLSTTHGDVPLAETVAIATCCVWDGGRPK